MKSTKRITGSLIGAGLPAGLLLLAACDGGMTPDPITKEDAVAVAELIGGASAGPLYDEGTAAAEGARETFELEEECPRGGSVKLSGTVDADDDGGSVEIDATAEYDRCDDGRIEITGTVNELHQLQFDVSDGTVHLEGSVDWTGEVDWVKADGGSGSCEVDVTLEAKAEVDIETGIWSAVSGGMSGVVCGHSVEGGVFNWWLDAL